MRCEVLLFAQARELAGRERLTLDLPERATVADALQAVMQRHPELTVLRGGLAIALDEHYAPQHTLLRDGCTLALIPPVSGG